MIKVNEVPSSSVGLDNVVFDGRTNEDVPYAYVAVKYAFVVPSLMLYNKKTLR